MENKGHSVLKVVSREMVKPSSPTPSHLRNYKVSFLDQFCPPYYSPLVLFYPPPLSASSRSSLSEITQTVVLKKSLSETLTRFYPLAGRFIKEENVVRCNDEGVEYLEARVHGLSFSELINDRNVDALEALFSIEGYAFLKRSPDEVQVAIQVNYFDCGGIALAMSYSHMFCDGSTVATFLQCWSSISRQCRSHIYPTFDAPDVLPPLSPPPTPTATPPAGKSKKAKETTMRSFMFSRSAIAALRARGTQEDKIVPSRYAAVTALLWKCLLFVLYEEKKSSKEVVMSVILQAVNLRSRMVPPLPDVSFGNISKAAVAAWPVGNRRVVPDDDHLYRILAKEVKDSAAIVDDGYARRRNDTDSDMGYLGVPLHEPFTKIFKDKTEKHLCSVTSWLRFPFYEINFGWGNPVWVSTCNVPGPVFLLINKSLDDNDNGIEAFVCLEVAAMLSFQKNPELLQFCFRSITDKTPLGKTISRL